MLFLERSGYTEETYHTFSYSPLFDDAGEIAGLPCVVIEDTEQVVAARRMKTLRDLGARRGTQLTEAETIQAACHELGGSSRDVPFSLLYLYDEQGTAARLACTTTLVEVSSRTLVEVPPRWSRCPSRLGRGPRLC